MLPRSSFFILSSSLLLLLAACEDTLQNSLPATGDGLPVTLTLDSREESAATRAKLENADPAHHVEQVEILIFEGEDDNAQWIDTETIKEWPKDKSSFTYTLQYPFVEGHSYTLLGVGKDDEFSNTYNIDTDKLGETYARLKANQSPARCEFFTGSVTFTHQGRGTQIDDLTMRRRVAGVMLYVTEIPQKVDGKRVTSVRLELGSNQKSSVLLKRDFTNPEWREPDGQDAMTEESKVLAQIDLSDYTYTDGKDFYLDAEGKPATGYTGVYMLPLNLTKDQPTFTVRLYGKPLKAQDGTGTVDETAEETLLSKEFVVENRSESNANATAFDIRSNYIYCIGKKGEGIDEPISLSGKPIYLDVTEWTIETNNPTFESARVQALFDDTDNPIHNCMNEEFSIKILPPLQTIRENVTKITLTVSNTTQCLDDQGLSKNDTDSKWLYIKDGDNYKASLDITDLVKSQEGSVNFLMLDYAVPRTNWGWDPNDSNQNGYQWDGTEEHINWINNDIRETDLILTTYIEWDKNGNGQMEDSEKITKTDVLTIKQYNTITVYYKGYDQSTISYCGFSREDYHEDDNYTFEWGFSGNNNGSVYLRTSPVDGYTGSKHTGAENLNAIFWATNFDNGWNGCAIQKSLYAFKKVNGEELEKAPQKESTDMTDDDNTKIGWCLPAQFELEGFMIMSASNTAGQINTNIEQNTWYWSSTLNGMGKKAAYAYNIQNGTYNRQEIDREKENLHRIRQVRKFSDYYDEAW